MFVAKNSGATSWHELLHKFGPFCIKFRKATKRSRMHPNGMKCTKTSVLGSNGVDRVRSLRKIPTQLRGPNFCTSSARFAPTFVRQPNGLECPQIVRNAPNVSLGFNGVDRVRSLQKIPTRLHGMNFCTSSARCAPSFVRQPNDPKSTKIIVRNASNHQFTVLWGGSDEFFAKNSNANSWHKLLH